MAKFYEPPKKVVGVGEDLGVEFHLEVKRVFSLRKNIIRNFSEDDLADFLCRIYKHGKSCNSSENCQFCNFQMCKGREYVSAWLEKEIGSGQDSFDCFNKSPIL